MVPLEVCSPHEEEKFCFIAIFAHGFSKKYYQEAFANFNEVGNFRRFGTNAIM
jgi:hypothetical protein